MPQHEVITVFLDIKDPFHTTASASQSAAVLDGLVLDALGEDHIYRPGDLLARAPGAESLQAAVAAKGWPTLEGAEGEVPLRGHRGTGGFGHVRDLPDSHRTGGFPFGRRNARKRCPFRVPHRFLQHERRRRALREEGS